MEKTAPAAPAGPTADQIAHMKLTKEQAQKLQLFLSHLTKNMKITNPRFLNPFILNNFLVTKAYNLEKTIKMFEEYLKFRLENKIDKLIEEDWSRFPMVKALYPRAFYHTDKQGRPILIEKVGKAKFSKLFKEFDFDYLKRMMHLNYELIERVVLPACSRQAGRPITQMTVIMDVKGVAMTDLMSKNVFNFVSLSSKMIQEYYPEIVCKTLIINTPMLFSGFFKLIKPLLNSRTQATLSLTGSGFKKELDKYIDPANLPAEYGGSCKEVFDGRDIGFFSQHIGLAFGLKKWDITEEDLAGPVKPQETVIPVLLEADPAEDKMEESEPVEDPDFDPNSLLDRDGTQDPGVDPSDVTPAPEA